MAIPAPRDSRAVYSVDLRYSKSGGGAYSAVFNVNISLTIASIAKRGQDFSTQFSLLYLLKTDGAMNCHSICIGWSNNSVHLKYF